VICYQNGLDNERMVAETFGEANTLRVVINYAGNFIADGKVTMNFFHKPNYIGVLTEDNVDFANRIAAVMTRADLETEYSPKIRTYVWEKVILNGALAPLSAITGMTMKEVTTFPDTAAMMRELLREGIKVAETDGCEFDDGFFDHCVWYLEQAGHHKPSMLIDIENRSPTEIEFLNGRICHHADNFGIPVPVNLTITQRRACGPGCPPGYGGGAGFGTRRRHRGRPGGRAPLLALCPPVLHVWRAGRVLP